MIKAWIMQAAILVLCCFMSITKGFASGSSKNVLLHHTTIAANIKFHWVEGGDPNQPTLLFLAGWPQTSYAWRKVMIQLANPFHVVSVDLPGLGDSGFSPSHQYDAKFVSNSIHSLVQTLGLKSIHLVGHDVGAWIAFAYAIQFQEELSSLILLDTKIPGIFPDPDPFSSRNQNIQSWQLSFNQLPILPELLVKGKEKELFTWLIHEKAARPDKVLVDLPVFLKSYTQPNRLTAGFEYYRAIPENLEMNRTFASKQKINIPLLAIGASKGVGGTLLTALKKIAPHSEGTVLENCGHYLAEECDEEVAKKIREFVQTS